MPARCIECRDDKVKARLDSLRGIHLCKTCAGTSKYKLVYKTYAQRDYFIDPDKLLQRGCVTYRRQVHGNLATLFRLYDVLDLFCEEHHVDRHNELAINQKQQELQRDKEDRLRNKRVLAQQRKEVRQKSRRKRLVAALEAYGLELRADSKLCHGYIEGTLQGWKIEEIVARMCQMRYLFDHCRMEYYLDKAYEQQQEELEYGYFPDVSVFEEAEHMALKKYGGYPNVWPWMTTEQQQNN